MKKIVLSILLTLSVLGSSMFPSFAMDANTSEAQQESGIGERVSESSGQVQEESSSPSLQSADAGIGTRAVSGYAVIAEGDYYIRNYRSNYYLDVYQAYTANGTKVQQWWFHGDPCQKWRIKYVGSGYYIIRPLNALGSALDVSTSNDAMGVKIDIWAVGASSTPDYALWKFVKNANGTYRILSKCSNDTRAMVVQGGSTDSGASVIQYSYNDTTNEMWVLESAKKGTATLNGSIQEDGLDRTSWLPNTAAATRDMGYSTITYQNPTAATAFTQLKNSSIWAVRAHGNSNGVLFYGGNKDSWLDCEMLSTLPYYSLYRNRMVVYAMCRGGSGGNSAYNIVNLTYQKGAKCVIGFEYTIVYTHANRWIYEFFYSSKNGKTVKQACNDADYWTGVYLASHGSTDFRLVRGNTAQHLTE